MEAKAFSRSVVQAIGIGAELSVADVVEVGFAREDPAQAADGIFDAALLPWAPDIAEEGLDAEAFVEAVMLGELGAVVEGDGSA